MLPGQSGNDAVLSVFTTANEIDFFSQLKPQQTKAAKIKLQAEEMHLQNALRLKDQQQMALHNNNLGYLNLLAGDYLSAVKHFQEAVDFYSKLHNTDMSALARTQLGFTFDQIGRDDDALKIYSLAASQLTESKNPKQLACISGLKGIIYLQKNDTINGNLFINAALAQFTQHNFMAEKIRLYARIGELNLEKNDFAAAVDIFLLELKIARALNDKSQIALANRNIGIAYFKKGDFEKSVDYFTRSLEAKEDLLVKKLLKDAYLKIVTISSFKNDFVKADKYHDLYRRLKSQIDLLPAVTENEIQVAEKEKIIHLLNTEPEDKSKILTQQDYELSRQLTALEIERQSKEKALEELSLAETQKKLKELELEKVSAQNARQEAELTKKELQISKQKEFRNILILISFLILLGILFLYNRYALKKRSLRELNEAHEHLNQAHEQLKQTQEKLIQSEKMASLGQLTAGIAHEIQNPLNFVNNFSTLSLSLIAEFEEDNNPEILADIKSNLNRIHHHGNRISSIVKGMLLHSRNKPAEKEKTDINLLVDESLSLAYHGRRSSDADFFCQIEKSFDESNSPVAVFAQDLRRVLINLFNNAFYAIQSQFEKLKSVSHDQEFTPTLKIATSFNAKEVIITIQDNGSGIPDAIKDKIFNPFFTSKPTGAGTGLGLSVSFDIIQKSHKGELKFESTEGKGTKFIIVLPLEAQQTIPNININNDSGK
jgi:signal transduction histidine kinase